MADTVGKISAELLQKEPETRDPIEIQREAQKQYIENLEWAVRHLQKKVSCDDLKGTNAGHDGCTTRESHLGDAYVVVITKKEHTMQNVIRNYFFTTLACPTPDYNQTVWKYHYKSDQCQYLWTVPGKEVCDYLTLHALEVTPDERQLLDFVLKFRDGTLLRQARELNGENIEHGFVLDKNSDRIEKGN